MDIAAQSLSHSSCCSASVLPHILPSKNSIFSCNAIHFQSSKSHLSHITCGTLKIKRQRYFGAVYASGVESPSTDVPDRWLLVPVGDGDSRHIGYEVKMPDGFEIASNVVTVGRLAEKADMVIPIATVSGVHARIQKKGGALLVTDLDSTNGTFIDDRRLRPGVVATVAPGNCIIFGDIHLAMFQVSKLENVEAASEDSSSENKEVMDSP